MYSQEFLSSVSTYEKFINPYKKYALTYQRDKKLTESQHDVARTLGFNDWQSFDYHMKKLYNEVIPSVNLTKEEWHYIFDALNGTIFTINYSKEFLLAELLDYDHLQEVSNSIEFDNYKAFIEKVYALSDLQVQGVLTLVQSWWGGQPWIEKTYEVKGYTKEIAVNNKEKHSINIQPHTRVPIKISYELTVFKKNDGLNDIVFTKSFNSRHDAEDRLDELKEFRNDEYFAKIKNDQLSYDDGVWVYDADENQSTFKLETLRTWYDDKDEQWFDKNLNSIVSIDDELFPRGLDKNGFIYYTIGESNNHFYPSSSSNDIIVLDNGEEYIID